MAPTAGRTALAVLLLPLLYTEGFLPGGCRALSRHAGSATAAAAAPRRARTEMKLDLTGGSYVALVTPMDAAGAVDEPCLRALLRWHLESGTDGLVVLGTTGEASTLSTEERGRVLQVTQEEVAGKIPVVVGTGGISPQQVIAHTRAAADAGADGCLIVTPYYVKPTQAGLVKFFTTVADAAPLPMVLYNVPGRTGVDMQTAAVAECARHPGIVGMKEATGDNSRVAPLLEACGPDFLLYSGDDGGGCEFVLKGGHGVISVTANIAPARMAQVMAAARAGQTDEANELNEPLQLLHQRLFLASNPIPAKWALKRMGRINTGALRLPLTELETQHHAPLEEGLRAAGLL